MRVHVSDDLGMGGFVLLCVGLLLSTVFQNNACVTCFQVRTRL